MPLHYIFTYYLFNLFLQIIHYFIKFYDMLGITVLGVEEEEYCYIPMGGELPDLTQRILGFGGAANMVHPATGNLNYS